MATKWQEVRVFISSTFQDMHAERDHLVKRVFPQLRERLLAYRIHLVDIDLRWGITEAEAENDRVLDLCLQQIDGCRPFFVGILGERYGWVPEKMPEMDRPEYGWVQGMTGKSATELEILHGVLRNTEMKGHAFFYFRDPTFGSELPEDLRATFIDEGENAEQLVALKDEIRASRFPVMEPYSARWDADEKHLTELEDFGTQIMKDLWRGIQSEHELPDEPPAYDDDPLAEERDYHDRFIESRTQIYIGRESVQEDLFKFTDGDGTEPCLMTGPSGSGKSAALAKFVSDYRDQLSGIFVLPHFVGASPRSTGLRDMLTRFCLELKAEFGVEDEIPQDMNELVAAFGKFMSEVPENQRVLIVIDALNQLDETDNAQMLRWMPQDFPSHVKVVVSCIDDPGRDEPVLEAFDHRPCKRLEITALTPKERFDIATEVPSVSAKKLDPTQMEHLLSNPATENPLYLLVALEELRGFGSFEALNDRIDEFPEGDDPVTALFIQVIDRLEDDFDTTNVRDLLSLLASARRGLSQTELIEVIEDHDDFAASTSDLFPILRQIRTYLQHRGDLLDFFHRNFYKATRSKYLTLENDNSTDSELSSHSIPPLKGDQGGCSPFTQQEAHARLADYFANQPNYLEEKKPNARRCEELPWQLAQAQRTADLESLLTIYDFLQAKITAFGPQTLIDDYDFLNLDHNSPLSLIQGCIQLASHILADDPNQLASQLHGRMLEFDEPKISKLLNKSAESQTSPWFRPISRCMAAPGGPLIRTLQGHTSGISSVVVTPDDKRVVFASSDETIQVWDLSTGKGLLTLEGHNSMVNSVAVTPDGTRAISGSYDNTLKVWDLATGHELLTLEGHARSVMSVAVTPDGLCAVSASEDKTLKVWDINTGALLKTLQGHKGGVACVTLTPDGASAVSVSEDITLKVWDLASGEVRKTLEGHTEMPWSVVITPDSKRVVSGSWDKTIKVWDFSTGEELATLLGHTDMVSCLAITPDGKRVVSGSWDKTIKVWDISTGEELATLLGHTDIVSSVTVTENGEEAVSASKDTMLKVWDLSKGNEFKNLQGHSDMIVSLAVTPDGARTISSSLDKTIRVWDLLTGDVLITLEGYSEWVPSLAVTPDGKWVVSASGKTLNVWELATGNELRTLEGHSGWVNSLAVTPDGIWVVSGSDELKLWDLNTGEEVRTLEGHSGRVNSLAVTPDGARAITAHSDYTIRVWDLTTGDELITLQGHTEWVLSLAVTPDSTRVISSSLDKTIRVWDLSTGDLLVTLQQQVSKFSDLAVTQDGAYFVSCSQKSGLKLWSLETFECLATFVGDPIASNCAFWTDDRSVIVGDDGGSVYVLRLEEH